MTKQDLKIRAVEDWRPDIGAAAGCGRDGAGLPPLSGRWTVVGDESWHWAPDLRRGRQKRNQTEYYYDG
jgi:hypothetical protein